MYQNADCNVFFTAVDVLGVSGSFPSSPLATHHCPWRSSDSQIKRHGWNKLFWDNLLVNRPHCVKKEIEHHVNWWACLLPLPFLSFDGCGCGCCLLLLSRNTFSLWPWQIDVLVLRNSDCRDRTRNPTRWALQSIEHQRKYPQSHMSVERERKDHTTSRLQQHQQPHQEGLAQYHRVTLDSVAHQWLPGRISMVHRCPTG